MSSADFSYPISVNCSTDSSNEQGTRPPEVRHISFTRSFHIYYHSLREVYGLHRLKPIYPTTAA